MNMTDTGLRDIEKTGPVLTDNLEHIAGFSIEKCIFTKELLIYGTIHQNGGGTPRLSWKLDGTPVTSTEPLDMRNIIIKDTK